MNKKEGKVARLWERGIRDPRVIAQKLGYTGSAMTVGVEWVRCVIHSLGLR